MFKRTPGLKERDMLLIYDNCSSHNGKISGWWMNNLRCRKLTVVPYTPEFNMVERLFNTLKWNSSDGVIREQILDLAEFLAWHIN